MLSQLRRFDEAVVAYEGYVRLRPRQYKGWMNLGVAHGNLGHHEDALRCFERALQIAPGDPRARAARDQAQAMLQRGRGANGG